MEFVFGYIAGLFSLAFLLLWYGHRSYKQQVMQQRALTDALPGLNDNVVVDAMAGGEMSNLHGVHLHGRQAIIVDMAEDNAIIEVDGKRYLASLGLLKKVTGSPSQQMDTQHSESPGDQQ